MLKLKGEVDVSELHLPREYKMPHWYEQGVAVNQYPQCPRDEYHQVYFKAIDLAVWSIESRLDQKGYNIFLSLKQFLLKACSGKCLGDDLKAVCNFYHDFNKKELASELLTFHMLYHSVVQNEETFIDSVKRALLS